MPFSAKNHVAAQMLRWENQEGPQKLKVLYLMDHPSCVGGLSRHKNK